MFDLKGDDIESVVKWAEDSSIVLPRAILEMDGMSTHKTRRLFNGLGQYFTEQDCYLEIGCWKGATFCAAMYGNPLNGIAVDNFSQFDDQTINGYEHQAGLSKEICLKNLKDLSLWNTSNNKFGLFQLDGLTSLPENFPTFQFYFYDGDHSEESHYKAFKNVDKFLDKKFLTIVDDWCDGKKEAAKGTRRAFKDLDYKITYEKILPHTGKDKNGWWNGLMIAIIEK